MDAKIDKLISLTMQIGKFIGCQPNVAFEERAATMLQFHVLSFLEKQPQAKLGDVAKHLNASVSSTTQLVERLHKTDLISRTGDETDRRITHLTLTEEGIKKLAQIKEAKHSRMKKLFSQIDDKDVDDLIRIQEKIAKSIQENPNL